MMVVMKRCTRLFFLFTVALLLAGCGAPENPPSTAQDVNLAQYMGTWYEIASIPNYFQKGCRCTRAVYQLKDNDNVSVANSCVKYNHDEFSTAHAKAWLPDVSNTSKLKVQFFWPFSANYWILYVDTHYQHAIVGTPDHKYLWILSRQKTMDEPTYLQLINRAKSKGYLIDKLVKTPQSCPILDA